jgi:hypothetical protein
MTGTEKIYFSPGANSPFPGYEDWLEEVKRAPIWQATGPRGYVPDMRDGLRKELFPPPPRSDLEPEESSFHDRDTGIAVLEYIWQARPDLVWEMLWWDQFSRDEPDAEADDYDNMFLNAMSYAMKRRFPGLHISAYFLIGFEFRRQIREIIQELPLSIRRAPWLRKKYKD